jgi:hypothetical protein
VLIPGGFKVSKVKQFSPINEKGKTKLSTRFPYQKKRLNADGKNERAFFSKKAIPIQVLLFLCTQIKPVP